MKRERGRKKGTGEKNKIINGGIQSRVSLIVTQTNGVSKRSELSHPKEIFPFHLINPSLAFKPSSPMIDHDWSLNKMSSFFATKTGVQWNSTSLWRNDFLIVQQEGKKKRERLVIVVQATPWSELKSLFHLCFLSLLYGMRGRYPHPWASYTVCAPVLREVISSTTVDAWKE